MGLYRYTEFHIFICQEVVFFIYYGGTIEANFQAYLLYQN